MVAMPANRIKIAGIRLWRSSGLMPGGLPNRMALLIKRGVGKMVGLIFITFYYNFKTR